MGEMDKKMEENKEVEKYIKKYHEDVKQAEDALVKITLQL